MLRQYRLCIAFSIGLMAVLAGCTGSDRPSGGPKVGHTGTTPHASAALPDGYKLGRPYEVFGVTYYPYHDPAFIEEGTASWYGADFHGQSTASGERYDMNAVTAAHKTLPLPSTVRVTNLKNGRSLLVRVNDRGPFVAGRVIDLSRRSAQLLGVYSAGTAPVKVEFVELAALTPDDTKAEVQYAELEDVQETAGDVLDDAQQAEDGEPGPVKLWSAKDGSRDERKAEPPAAKVVRSAPEPEPSRAIEVSTIDGPIDADEGATNPADEPVIAPLPPKKMGAVQKVDVAPKKVVRAESEKPSKSPKRDDGGFLISSANAAEIEVAEISPAARSQDIFVQVGAFASRDSANQIKKQLASLGPIFVEPSRAGGRQVFRVRFGPMASHDAADSLLDRLVESGYVTSKLIVETN